MLSWLLTWLQTGQDTPGALTWMSLGPDKNSENPLMVTLKAVFLGMYTHLSPKDPILHLGLRPSRYELVEAF